MNRHIGWYLWDKKSLKAELSDIWPWTASISIRAPLTYGTCVLEYAIIVLLSTRHVAPHKTISH